MRHQVINFFLLFIFLFLFVLNSLNTLAASDGNDKSKKSSRTYGLGTNNFNILKFNCQHFRTLHQDAASRNKKTTSTAQEYEKVFEEKKKDLIQSNDDIYSEINTLLSFARNDIPVDELSENISVNCKVFQNHKIFENLSHKYYENLNSILRPLGYQETIHLLKHLSSQEKLELCLILFDNTYYQCNNFFCIIQQPEVWNNHSINQIYEVSLLTYLHQIFSITDFHDSFQLGITDIYIEEMFLENGHFILNLPHLKSLHLVFSGFKDWRFIKILPNTLERIEFDAIILPENISFNFSTLVHLKEIYLEHLHLKDWSFLSGIQKNIKLLYIKSTDCKLWDLAKYTEGINPVRINFIST